MLAGFDGTLCTDFYAVYSQYEGPKQGCWSHVLRAAHDLEKEHPDKQVVQDWCIALKVLYGKAINVLADPLTPAERIRFPRQLEKQAWNLGRCYARNKDHPCHALAQRLQRYESALFTFVRNLDVVSTNNLAERSVRPQVIARKISGGSRSTDGAAIRCALATLFGTWHARGLNPFAACLAALQTPQPQP